MIDGTDQAGQVVSEVGDEGGGRDVVTTGGLKLTVDEDELVAGEATFDSMASEMRQATVEWLGRSDAESSSVSRWGSGGERRTEVRRNRVQKRQVAWRREARGG